MVASKRKTRQRNDPKEITRQDYPAVFGDSDRDQIPDVDDPHPFVPGDTKSIEEIRLSDEIGSLIDTRASYVPATKAVMKSLRDLQIPKSKVEGRVKTPFSIVNKLRRKYFGSLTDVAATRILLPDRASVDLTAAAIEEDFEILEKEDFYKTPQAGYRAIHYIVRAAGVPVEVQVKTHRMAEIAEGSHTPYKTGKLNAAEMDRLTTLAVRADKGDKKAQRELDPLLRDKRALQRSLTLQSNPRAARKARRLANP